MSAFRYDKADAQPVEPDNIMINISDIHQQNNFSTTNINRRVSATRLVKDADGTLKVERKNTDLGIAIQRRISAGSLPSIIPIKSLPTVEPLLGAEDALNRKGGKGAAGAFSEHMHPLEVIADNYHTHIDYRNVVHSRGLTHQKAEQLLHELGPNVLTPPPRVPLWLLFLLQFTNLLMVLLLIVSFLCIILYAINPTNLINLYLGVLLFIAIFITCYETFSQEAKSDSLMEKFRAMVPEQASVIRDGVMKPLSATEIVIGDIIRLKSGDKVPADCRVIQNLSMKVDQAMITGESEPVDSSVIASDPNALEARNIIFSGSLVVDGACLAVVIRTGDDTLIGSMVELTGDVGKDSSTLKQDIEYFVKVLTAFALFQAVIIFIVGLSKGLDPVVVFVNGFVIIMIGNIPQGLPTTVTACLFIVADNMGKQNVFVKKLDVIETLGSCSLICTDKTGTLTQNLMSVANAWCFGAKRTNDEYHEATKAEVASTNHLLGRQSQALALLQVASLNSRVALERKDENSELKPNGDATELGLYRFFTACIKDRYDGLDIEKYRSDNPKVFEIPFNSSFKWQLTIHNMASSGKGEGREAKQMLFLKGAPDVLMGKCSRYLDSDGSIKLMDERFNTIYTQSYEEYGGNGERVLGFAMKPMDVSFEAEMLKDPKYKDKLRIDMIGKPTDTTTPINDLIFVGLVTLIDPPRPEVPQAIKDCHTAGVKVVMVTGDHPLTAQAIARKIGLITTPTRDDVAKMKGIDKSLVNEDDVKAVVVKGADIPTMTEDDWKILVSKQEIVFARTSPEQKLTIVQEFTKAGNITAMTGDGVNDSPALKQAAIGVAMGLNGSDVAREAADLVLLDDNFASIVVGIKEGRLLFANLKKSIAYSLAHLVPEVLPVLLWAFVGMPQPMGSLLALCIDLLTELVPATSFAYERAESLIMQVPPRNPKTDKLTSFNLLFYAYGQAGIILTGGCFLTFFLAFQFYGLSASDVVNTNNSYFPAAPDSNDIYKTSDGRVYDEGKQNHILFVVQAAWYMGIVVGQASHVFVCRTSTVSIFEHGVFTNNITNIGVVVAIALGCFVVYTPGLQDIVQSRNPFSLHILYCALLNFVAHWSTTEARKYMTRNYPEMWLNKYLAW